MRFLERLSLRICGFLMIVVGTILIFFASLTLAAIILSWTTNLAQKWLPGIAIGIELFVGFFAILLLPTIIPTTFFREMTFQYRLLKRRWLMKHGIAVEVSLLRSKLIVRDSDSRENKDRRTLTLAWQPAQGKRKYAFKKTILETRFVNFSLFLEHPYIVIFDPSAPSFYDIQLPDEAFLHGHFSTLDSSPIPTYT